MLFFSLFNIINIASYSQNGPGSISFKLNPGRYRVLLYGAQGGSGYYLSKPYVEGGRGTLINATLNVQDWKMQFYTVVGGMGGTGQTGSNLGGSNGGGSSGSTTSTKGSGGGGGATDLRVVGNTTNNWIFVAAGGSGGVGTCSGAPGGSFFGLKKTSKTGYAYDTSINQTSGYAILNGSKGSASTNYPGSGGGGGYYGGTGGSGVTWVSDSCDAVGRSGSSYVFGCNTTISGNPVQCKATTFPNISWSSYSLKVNITEGNGAFQLTEEFLCPENCTRCTSSTTCSECRNSYFTFNPSSNKCELSCPNKTFIDGFSCSSCPENCDSCESLSFCTSCSSGFYMYNNFCYSDCSVLNQPDKNLYFGINDDRCSQCSDRNCIDCSEDSTICQNCEEGFLLQENQCISIPSNEFSHSNDFSNSMEFSQSDRFSDSNDFSNSMEFSQSDRFSYSNDFSNSLKFSNSNLFSTSEEFTNLIAFSNSKEETLATNNDNPPAAGLEKNLTHGLPSSSIIIIVLSTLVAIAIIVAIILFVLYKRKSRKDEKDTDIEMPGVTQIFTIAVGPNLDVATDMEKEESINSMDDPFNVAMTENDENSI